MDRLLDTEIHIRTPFASWEIHDVVVEITNLDTVIHHTLAPDQPGDVQYQIIRQTGTGVAYESRLAKAWTTDFVVLRFTQAGNYRLLLTVLKTPVEFTI